VCAHLLELLLSLLDILELVLLLVRIDPLVRQILLQRLPLVLLLERRIDRESLVAKLHPLILEGEDLSKAEASRVSDGFFERKGKTRFEKKESELTLSESFSIDPA